MNVGKCFAPFGGCGRLWISNRRISSDECRILKLLTPTVRLRYSSFLVWYSVV